MQETLNPLSSSKSESLSQRRDGVIYLQQWIAPLGLFVLLFIAWSILANSQLYPSFIIPSPGDVWAAFQTAMADGSLWNHTLVTLQEVLQGLLFGGLIGIGLGVLLAKNQFLARALAPLIVAFQSTPTVAYAPLLIIWFGSGMTSKVVTSAIIVFFPMMMNTMVGIRSVPQSLYDVMASLRATPWQIFWKLEVRAAMPILLTGLKTSATLSVIGAVVGEFVSAGEGLGYLVELARNQYNTPLVLVSVFMMTLMALSLYAIVSLIERFLLQTQIDNPYASKRS